MGKNRKNAGIQQGAQRHAESQHGDKTRKRQAEIANTPDPLEGRTGPQYDPEDIREHDTPGKDRLFADRQQHDDAEKQSEKTRLSRDIERHGHED